jgi:hypothetical protein
MFVAAEQRRPFSPKNEHFGGVGCHGGESEPALAARLA